MITAVDPPSEPQYTSINTNTNNAGKNIKICKFIFCWKEELFCFS
jgi:hypothetical protein